MRGKKLLTVILIIVLAVGVIPFLGFADQSTQAKLDNIVILYTGNLKGSVEDNIGIDGLVAYTNEKKDVYNYVGVIDSGNNTKGTVLADKTNGGIVVGAMNVGGYSVSVPGQAELGNGVGEFLALAKSAKYSYVSANLYQWGGVEKQRVFAPYKMVSYGDTKVAYVGITSYDALSPYDSSYYVSNSAADIQEAIAQAYMEGAKYVIALGNVTESEAKALIKNLSGLNCFINSQDTPIVGDKVQDKDAKNVILTSTGARMENVGVMTIYTGTLISTQLLSNYNAKNIAAREAITTLIDARADVLQTTVGTVQFTLNAVSSNGARNVENGETNLGDLVADAVRASTYADVALIPATEFQSSILVGDITYADVLETLPYNKDISIVEMKGSDLMDAIEMATRLYPDANDEFLQVSGITFDISETTIPSVRTDYYGKFVSVDDEYRVTNVKVNGADLSLYRTYKVATTNEMINGSTGYSMFSKGTVTKKNVTIANSALIDYITYGFNSAVPNYYSSALQRIDSYFVIKRSELEAKIDELAQEKVKNYVAQISNLKADMSELNEIYALTTMEITASSSFYTEGSKRRIKVMWKTSEPIDGLSYQVYRSTSKNSGYSKAFTTKNMQYTNTSNLYKGNTYYYKVRAYKTIKGKTYYSEWSNVAYRKVTK